MYNQDININLLSNIQQLVQTLGDNGKLKYINTKLISTNAQILCTVSKKLYPIIDSLNKSNGYSPEHNISNPDVVFGEYTCTDVEFKRTEQIINNSMFEDTPKILRFIKKAKYQGTFSYKNIIQFTWLSTRKKIIDIDLAYTMFLITVSLYKFSENTTTPNQNIKRVVIWLPLKSKRDFKDKHLHESNLKRTVRKFKAFTPSGVTFQDYSTNTKISIVTRYEEVEKLLIHELIHNYCIDGTGYHKELNSVISKYKSVKNNTVRNTYVCKCSNMRTENANTCTKTRIKNYDYDFSIYEIYTELLSGYFYLLYKNYFSNKIQSMDANTLHKTLCYQIILELLYSYNLICNLIDLNNYLDYEDFERSKIFIGELCVYEYYFVKAISYNNLVLEFGSSPDDFVKLYEKIIDFVNRYNGEKDKLMEAVYNSHFKWNNFKYIMH